MQNAKLCRERIERMIPDLLATCKQGIIEKLREVGISGLPKSKLPGTSKSKLQAVEELEKSQVIVNIGTTKSSRYILKEFEKLVPEKAARKKIIKKTVSAELFDKPESIIDIIDIIEKNAIAASSDILTQKELTKGCKGSAADVEEAIRQLSESHKLLKLKSSKTIYFLHISKIQSLMPSVQPVSENKAISELNRERILGAYRKISERIRFPDVEIYALQQEIGCDMETLKAFLLEESRKGNAVLSYGDWSLSDENIRSAAIHIRGKAHLLVHFKH